MTVTGYDPVGCITIDSTKADPTCLAALEAKLYGTGSGSGPELPLPAEVITLMDPRPGSSKI